MPRPAVALACLLPAASLAAATAARAEVRMAPDVASGIPPALFRDGMNLQRKMTGPIFGRAGAGGQVTVTFDGRHRKTITGFDGE